MADTRVVLPACPCPIRARLRRLAPSYTFTGCLLPQAYGKGDTARNEDEYRVQASPTTPAKLLMLTQGMGRLKGRDGPFLAAYFAFTNFASGMTSTFLASEYVLSPGYKTHSRSSLRSVRAIRMDVVSTGASARLHSMPMRRPSLNKSRALSAPLSG